MGTVYICNPRDPTVRLETSWDLGGSLPWDKQYKNNGVFLNNKVASKK